MYEYNLDKVAKLAINYAIGVKSGDKVLIQAPIVAQELIRALVYETIQAGGHPEVRAIVPGLQEMTLMYGSDEQLQFVSPMFKTAVETYDALINVFADYNTHKLEQIPAERLQKAQMSKDLQEMMKIFEKRESAGELKWTIVPYPCDAMAQEAGMDLFSYEKFVAEALKLSVDNPAEEWRKIEQEQASIVEQLNKVKTIHVVGEDTDLTVDVSGRTWVNSCGHKNLPDGEIFTSPVEDNINGKIRFTYPGIFQGKEIENIYLEIENGKVVKATADKGQELLDSVLQIPGADHFGEFAIGTNYGITKFTKNMLFDEKIGGTLHMALGRGFPETGGKNQSTIHWDILKDMHSEESIIYADDKIIYQAGKWKIE
ncbi:MAG: aminopeptidase [Candidatus Lokiarchaeota archaeon]|nr:aminopeptidase [Candidatus Harpocratesius repetitus]